MTETKIFTLRDDVGPVPARVVILAGGQGTRFWPISRLDRPKQFLSISSSGESLIQATVRRVEPLCTKHKVLVVCNTLQTKLVMEHVPGATTISEPIAKNTAASIGLAALKLRRESADVAMIVLPSDHAVIDEHKLIATLQRAATLALREDVLVTVGIQPTSPHTGYGYIKRGAVLGEGSYRVSRFYEKPSLERARRYFEGGGFYWNSGMFVWRPSVYLKAVEQYMPELYAALTKIDQDCSDFDNRTNVEAVVLDAFSSLEAISVDFGVLEHARNCCVVEADQIGWSDVGSWDAWANHFKADSQGNMLYGEALLIDSSNCVVHSENKLTAVLGGEDLIIINSPDALLICPRSRVQEVRKVVDQLKAKGRGDLI